MNDKMKKLIKRAVVENFKNGAGEEDCIDGYFVERAF
jgi:hypothetical protein